MQVEHIRLRYLLRRYLDSQVTADELQELRGYVSEADNADSLSEVIDDLWAEHDHDPSLPIPSDVIYQAILQHPHLSASLPVVIEHRQRNRAIWFWVAGTAASLCIGITMFLYDLFPTATGVYTPEVAFNITDSIMPGGNKATLIISEGQRIDLSAVQNGIVIGDKLTYEDGSTVLDLAASTASVSNLQLETPKGGTYQVTLSDGTKVWLNAASKLKYPSRFTGEERIVDLEGEAYFDVVSVHKNGDPAARKIPFLVKTRGQTVQVLGTEFNVTAYGDEAETKTTLVEGSVNVLNLVSHLTNNLNPGKQSVVYGAETSINVVDIEPYTAWKNGYFAFPDAHISHVMNTIARWYDIEVSYEGDMTDRYFGGTISRFEDFKTLLKTIELTGSVKFKIEGRRVTVMT